MNQLTNALSVTDLTDVDTVKEYVQGDVDPDYTQDDVIGTLITHVSGRIVSYLGTHAVKTARTEIYELRQHKRILSLQAGNVDATPLTVKHSSQADDFSGLGALDSSLYVLNGPGGFIRLRVQTGHDPNYFEVTYTGGLGATLAAIQTSYPDIVHACTLQVKYLLQRSDTLGGNVQAVGAGAGGVGKTEFTGQYRLLRDVEELLEIHRRAQV